MTTMTLRRLDARSLGVDGVARALDRAPEHVAASVHQTVAEILAAVRERGDAALVELTERFDRVALAPAGLARDGGGARQGRPRR